ncbi:MAG: hypothetical protein AB1298_08350 [Bacteroidota bacterium]
MKRKILFWILAFVITMGFAVYQRISGPTYPRSGSINFEGKRIEYYLERSYSSSSNYLIKIKTGDPSIRGILKWRQNYKARDPFNVIEMTGYETLSAELPAQPPLEKLQYFIELKKGSTTATVPEDKPIIIRYKGDVPIWILIPHILAMFIAMMFSTRAGLEFFNDTPDVIGFSRWAIILLFIGGFPLGFLMNYFAFGQVWSGFPFGNDITDNKTLIAFAGWLLAYFMIKKNLQPKLFALLAAILMILVYSIPHSV